METKMKKQYEKLELIGFTSGACFFISKQTLEKIGYFDPHLFAYHDDVELCWRAACRGIKSFYVPTSIIYHHAGTSFSKLSEKRFYLIQRNRWYCLLTHYSRRTFYRILPSLIVIELVSFFLDIFTNWKKSKISILVLIDLIKDRKQIKKKYDELESKKILLDKQVIYDFLDMPKYRVKNTRKKIRIQIKLMNVLNKLSRMIL